MTIMNADDMDSNVLGMAVLFYILADLDVTIVPDNPPQWFIKLIYDYLTSENWGYLI